VKKFLLVLFLVFALASAGAVQYFNFITVPDNYTTSPSTVYAGDTVTLNISVSNASFASGLKAENSVVTLLYNEKYFEPVEVVQEIGKINPGETKSVPFRLKIKNSAYPGDYRFTVDVNYFVNGSQAKYTKDINFSVSECYRLDVQDISLSNYTPHIGESFSIEATVKNICSGGARNAQIELVPVTSTSFAPFLLLSSNVVELGNLEFLESEKVSFSLRAADGSSPGTYDFKLKATCDSCSDSEKNISFDLVGKPELIISGIDFSLDSDLSGKKIVQGSTFSLSVQLDNIGEETAKAVKVEIDVDEGITGPKESYVGNIDEGDSGAAIFDLATSQNAMVGEHNAKIVIHYLDEFGEQQSISQNYSIFVNEAPPESPVVLLIVIAVILVLIYFIIKLVFRQLSLRKARGK
jgi:hypothetical protein